MGMRIGPKYKIARRLGEKIFSKCQTTKFATSGSDQRKTGRRTTVSEYGRQLLEKQKARYTYCVSEKQFSNYIKKARAKHGVNPSLEVYKHLETRLDNVVFRLGLTISRSFARQIISHGHILVNGKKITIASYVVKVGDKISVREQSKAKGLFRDLEERLKNYKEPDWMIFDEKKMTGEIKKLPEHTEGESTINFSSILEFYSRV